MVFEELQEFQHALWKLCGGVMKCRYTPQVINSMIHCWISICMRIEREVRDDCEARRNWLTSMWCRSWLLSCVIVAAELAKFSQSQAIHAIMINVQIHINSILITGDIVVISNIITMTIVPTIPCNVASIVSSTGGMAFGVTLVVTKIVHHIAVVIVTTIMGVDISGSIVVTNDTIYIKTQFFRLLRYYSPAPRNITRIDWVTQNITLNMALSIVQPYGLHSL